MTKTLTRTFQQRGIRIRKTTGAVMKNAHRTRSRVLFEMRTSVEALQNTNNNENSYSQR